VSRLVAANVLITLGIVVGNAMLARLHVLAHDLSPVRLPISAYGLSTYRRYYALQNATFVGAGGGASLAVHLRFPHAFWLPLCCLTYALGIAVIVFFPMDPYGASRTRSGTLHIAGAILIFGSGTVASVLLGHVARGDGGPVIQTYLTGVSIFLVAGIAAMVWAKVRRWTTFGAVERIAAAGLSAWLLAVLLVANHW
jgi:Protein of unknown function (DUF998)